MNGDNNTNFHPQMDGACFSEINSKYKHLTCRLCLCSSGSSGTLCDIHGSMVSKGWTVAAVISDLLGIEVSAADCYPQLVCLECLKKLCEYRSFKDLCLQAKLNFDMGLQSNAVLIHPVDPEGRFGVRGITEEMSGNCQSKDLGEHHPNPLTEGTVIGNDFTSEFIIKEELIEKSELRDPLSLEPEQNNVEQTLGESLTIKTEESQDHITQLGIDDREYESEEHSFTDPSSPKFCNAKALKMNEKLERHDTQSKSKRMSVIDPSKRKRVKETSSDRIICRSISENSSAPEAAIYWKCDTCDKCFSERRYLMNHNRMVHEEKVIIQCDHCLKPCFGKKNLENHMVTHSGKFPFNCEWCKKGFLYRKSAERHAQIHEGAPFKCDQCGIEAHSRSIIYEHIQKEHVVVFPCSMCHRTFSRKNGMKMHFYHKHMERNFQCSHCSQKFYKKESLDFHEKMHGHDWPFKCKICHRSFPSEKLLQNHLSSHDSEKSPLKCDWCDREYLHQGFAASHAKMHDGAPFKCDECGLEFVHIKLISEHIQKKHGNKRHCCSKCSKGFFRRHEMLVHFKRRHTEKNFRCESCPRKFHSEEVLEKHKRIHSRVHPFECKLCKRHFLRESFYRRHMTFHSEDVPFVCDACGKEFNYKRRLRAHLRNVHMFKRHSCHICKRKFSIESSLKKHMTVHTKERNNMCEICGKTFRQVAYLGVHRRTHTGEKPYCCSMCNKRFTQRCTLSTHIKLYCKKVSNP